MSERSATTFDVVRFYDPAIYDVNSTEDLAEHGATRDASKLKIEDGKRPVIFVCRALSREQRRHVKDYTDGSFRQNEIAFRYGIVEIKDIDEGEGTYRNYTVTRKSEKDPITTGVLDAIEKFGFGDDDVADIGSVIVARSFLAKGVPLRSQPPASSVRACVLMQLRRAAPKSDEKTQEGG
jgi:hypothetical protein